jgi:hypothetical protein
MKTRISALQPQHTFVSLNNNNLYFADYTNQDTARGIHPNRGAQFSANKFTDINSVHLHNRNSTLICFDRFPDFAFPNGMGGHYFQCECSIFPDRCNIDDWILFIETKYSKTLGAAENPSNAHLKKAIVQIVRTVFEYRQRGIIPQDKLVYGIVSFPVLIEQFNETFFQTKQKWVDLIMKKHKILIRGINSAEIRSETSLKLRPVSRIIP